jgi:hypothetical protein
MGLVSNIMRNGVAWLLSTTAMPAQNVGLFAYDHSIPFHYQEQLFEKDAQIEIAGAGFQSPKGGKVNMVVVRPRARDRLRLSFTSTAAARPCSRISPRPRSWPAPVPSR